MVREKRKRYREGMKERNISKLENKEYIAVQKERGMILKESKRYDQERNKEIKKRRKGLKEILKDYHHEYEFF